MSSPRQPPTPARVPTNAPAPTAPVAKAPTAPPTATTPPAQMETENARHSGNDTLNMRLERNWDENQVIQSILNGDHFEKNPANHFNNLAYHWRIFVMGPRNFLFEKSENDDEITNILDFYQRIDSYQQINIAETGVTGFNISEIEIEQVFGGELARSSSTTAISFKVLEPNGVAFLDALLSAAQEVGIQNYADFFYYMELTFKGYDNTGSINTAPFTDLPNGGRWIWAINITEIEVNLGSGGGQYRVSALPVDQGSLAQNSDYGQLLDTTMVRAETVGEFFDELRDKINMSWKNRLLADTITHDFKIHGVPTTTKITPPEPPKVRPRPDGMTDEQWKTLANIMNNTPWQTPTGPITSKAVRGMNLRPEAGDWSSLRGSGMVFLKPTTNDQGAQGALGGRDNTENASNAPTAHLPAGTLIPSIIDIVFSSCERAQCLARDSSANVYSADTSDDAVNEHGYRETVTWHTIPEIKVFGKYDALAGRYKREIVWHIYPRISQESILSRTQIKAARDDAEGRVQRGMLSALAARGFLQKRYDYLFTGLNTEVLNFDMNFNMAWQVQLPMLANYFNDQNLDWARYNQDRAIIWGDPVARLSASTKDFHNRLDEARETIVDARADGIITEEELKKITDQGNNIKSLLKVVKSDQERVAEARRSEDGLFEQVSIEQDYNRSYIETIMDNGPPRSSTRPVERHFPPISISESGGKEAQRETGFGMVGQYHAGKTLYGAILSQIYAPPTTRFQEIDLTIRGDPYWLSHGTFEAPIIHRAENEDNSKTLGLYGSPCIMFKFKYPVDVGNDGNIQLRPNEAVTGIYSITSVKSKFAGGKFEHELHGFRLPLIDVLNVKPKSDENIEDD